MGDCKSGDGIAMGSSRGGTGRGSGVGRTDGEYGDAGEIACTLPLPFVPGRLRGERRGGIG